MLFHRPDLMMWCCFDKIFCQKKVFLGSTVVQASFVHMMRMVHEVFVNIIIIVIDQAVSGVFIATSE